ncbi:MAG: type I-C CRISPR-associated protein Cas8c/Csd1 [Permianibacter sp.]
MIIPALCDYYRRNSELPPDGFERKEIPYLLVIDRKGSFIGFQDTQEGEGRSRRAKSFVVPSLGEGKGSGIKANLLWENIEYLLGVPCEGSNPDRVQKQHAAFIARINQLPNLSKENEAIEAALLFLNKLDLDSIRRDPLWSVIYESKRPVALSLAGVGCIAEQQFLRQSLTSTGFVDGTCLVTGESEELARLHAPIKGVRGDDGKAERYLVSFQKGMTFDSYGKEQGANAPMGKRTVFAYTTALNHLLGKDSRQKVQLGDASTVFWSETNSGKAMEDLFGELVAGSDNPDQGTDRLRALYALEAYQPLTDDDGQKFFVLGLSPNAARISVRFWHIATIRELGERIFQHFHDLQISRPSYEEHRHISIWHILRALLRDDSRPSEVNEKSPPHLAGAVLQSVLTGSPYPPALLQACIRRIRAELGNVTSVRAALLKACLNRLSRAQSSDMKEEITVSLDTSNDNTGYRLGRLFAALERVQERAQGNLNASIRERYYGAASSTPATVLPLLMKLKNHHLAKLDNRGEAVNLEKLLGEIMDGIDTVPAHLPLPDQARFALGYYHQRQAFFDKT